MDDKYIVRYVTEDIHYFPCNKENLQKAITTLIKNNPVISIYIYRVIKEYEITAYAGRS